MPVILQPSLPWSGAPDEERRFRQILGVTVVVFLAASLIVPRLQLPTAEPPEAASLPARFARIIADPLIAKPPIANPRAAAEVAQPSATKTRAPRPESQPSPAERVAAPAQSDAVPPRVAAPSARALTDTATAEQAPAAAKQTEVTEPPGVTEQVAVTEQARATENAVIEKAAVTEESVMTGQTKVADKAAVTETPLVAGTVERGATPARQAAVAAESAAGVERLTDTPPQQASRERAADANANAAASAGVLAMSASLSALARTRPKIASDRVEQPLAGAGQGADAMVVARADRLAVGVTRGSGGAGVDAPSRQALLAVPGLAPEAITGRGPAAPSGGEIRSERAATGTAVGEVRSEAEIQEILNRNKRAIYRIYNRELRKDPRLRGKVVVSITISAAGRVTGSRITYTELKAEALEKKLLLLIKRIDFGAKPGVPTVTTTVPIEFFPA